MASCNPNTILASGKDFQRCSKKELLICISQLLCNISTGLGAWTSGTGAPSATPTSTGAGYIDTATGKYYLWYSSAWHGPYTPT
jgi:hypothetical protein